MLVGLVCTRTNNNNYCNGDVTCLGYLGMNISLSGCLTQTSRRRFYIT